MTLASDLSTELLASWNTGVIAKPTFKMKEAHQAELALGTGWISDGGESRNADVLGSGSFAERTTPFEIFIACENETNYAKYKSEVERIIEAKSVTGGWWEITEFPDDRTSKRYNFHAIGEEKIWS